MSRSWPRTRSRIVKHAESDSWATTVGWTDAPMSDGGRAHSHFLKSPATIAHPSLGEATTLGASAPPSSSVSDGGLAEAEFGPCRPGAAASSCSPPCKPPPRALRRGSGHILPRADDRRRSHRRHRQRWSFSARGAVDNLCSHGSCRIQREKTPSHHVSASVSNLIMAGEDRGSECPWRLQSPRTHSTVPLSPPSTSGSSRARDQGWKRTSTRYRLTEGGTDRMRLTPYRFHFD